MKCLLLCAGYATRLYPLTENFPKPLLKVGEKTIIDWLIDDVRTAGIIDQFVVISNHKYFPHFEEWAKDKAGVAVIDDLTTSNETRLGAVRDIQFAVETLGLQDDLLVLAGDNVLDFSLNSFIGYALEKKTSCIMRYWEPEAKRLSRSGVSEIDENEVVTSFEEKPAEPKSHWCTPPFYYYTNADAKLIPQAIAEGCNTDAPGHLISWLCRHTVIHSMKMPGSRYDIGNMESYEKVKREYKGVEK